MVLWGCFFKVVLWVVLSFGVMFCGVRCGLGYYLFGLCFALSSRGCGLNLGWCYGLFLRSVFQYTS